MDFRPAGRTGGLIFLALALAPGAGRAMSAPEARARTKETRPVTIEAWARAIAPGEPIRIVVHAREPLADVSGSFDGQTLFFTETGAGSGSAAGSRGGTAWSAWSLVPLDRKAGKARVDIRARATNGGREDALSLDLTVKRRTFPEQKLDVEEKFVTPPPDVEERIAKETAELAAVYAELRAAAPPAHAFVRPVPGEPTGIFGTRRIFNGKPRSPHPGLDLKAAAGTLVHCSGAGIVALAEDLYFSGNTVIVDHGGGLFTIYAHLSRIDVEKGRAVDANDALGLSGATGRVTGPHLHWGAKIGNRPFDPTALLSPQLFR